MNNWIFKHKKTISYVIILFLTVLSFNAVCISQSGMALANETEIPLGGNSSIVAMLHSPQVENAREAEGADARLVENRQTLIRGNLLRSLVSLAVILLHKMVPIGMLAVIRCLLWISVSLSLIFIIRFIHDKDGRKDLLSLLKRYVSERKDSNVRKGYHNNLYNSMFRSSDNRMVDGKWTIKCR